MSPGRLRSIEPTIALTPRHTRREQDGAYLLTAGGSRDSYNVTARALNGDTYAIVRESSFVAGIAFDTANYGGPGGAGGMWA
jgi:hypothetical protein